MTSFLKQFIKDPKRTGAIAASSEDLAKLITKTADLSKSKSVVELGSGTGVFTESILENISKDAVFFALEINSEFVKVTKKRCPSAIVYQDSVINLKYYLNKHGLDKCDRVISGLPWASFDKKSQEIYLDSVINSLADGGKFLTFAYLQGLFLPAGIRFNDMLYSNFKEVKSTRIIWNNMPPAFVYHCIK